MADAEQILLVALRLALVEYGGVPSSVVSMADIGASELVCIVARSLKLMDGEASFSEKLGAGAASRHRACTGMAARLKDLGYDGEIGFNQLLYPSEASTRSLLTWLVDRLPRGEDERFAAEAVDAGSLSRQRALTKVAAWRKAAWRLPVCETFEKKKLRWRTWSADDFFEIDNKAPTLLEIAALATVAAAKAEAAATLLDDDLEKKDEESTSRVSLPKVDLLKDDSLPSLRDMLATLEAAHSERLSGGLGRLAHAAKFDHQNDSKTTTEDAPPPAAPIEEKEEESALTKMTKELEKLGEEYRRDRAKVLTLEAERESALLAKPDLEAEIEELKKEGKVLEKDYVVRRKTLEMLPEAAKAITKLTDICAAAQRRVQALEAEWDEHRLPLQEKIDEKKNERLRSKARARAMVDEMKQCRSDMQLMLADLAEKDERAKVLEAEYAKIPKHVNRALYTYRIMDVISSITKQKKEMTKIIDDITKVQKQNNKISDTLRRTEAIADERVYQASLADPSTVEAYESLFALRQLFETLVTCISDTGARDREARGHETKRKQLQSRVDANNIKRILDDLNQVKAENDKLIAKLRSGNKS